jgi:hypothetical protein
MADEAGGNIKLILSSYKAPVRGYPVENSGKIHRKSGN